MALQGLPCHYEFLEMVYFFPTLVAPCLEDKQLQRQDNSTSYVLLLKEVSMNTRIYMSNRYI